MANMVSLELMYGELVKSNQMERLTTFPYSQDHVESFFGRIRSCHGFNDNPNAQQFCGSFRKVVISNEIRSLKGANCEDRLDILAVSSRRPHRELDESSQLQMEPFKNPISDGNWQQTEHIPPEVCEMECEFRLDDLEKTSIAYVAGQIEQKIMTQAAFNCHGCRDVFSVNDKICELLFTGKFDSIRIPCESTYKICYISNNYLKILARDGGYTYELLFSDIWQQINVENVFAKKNFEGHEEHKEFFIKIIIEEFIRKQANCIAQEVTRKEKGLLLRNVYAKHIHRSGQ